MRSSTDLRRYPTMTRWFDPRLLAKLILQVIVSKLFGQYADRRLVIAALDTVDDAELQARADVTGDLTPDQEGAVWIDYVSDLGDGFDATYAIAHLLAQERLVVDGSPLPRGGVLVMGGDQVYPTSGHEPYTTRLREPYKLAFPNRPGEPHPPVFMVPGNHDWYDGLVSFLGLFCRKKPTSLGNWRTRQRRSYFALRLTPDWWLWAIDIALTDDMDQPQADYFVAIAAAMPDGARIILCCAEPGWYEADIKASAFRILDYAVKLADNACKHVQIVVALSGDKHHYARYTSSFGTQFVTSGGGGAFLHGTHNLKDEIELDWLGTPAAKLALQACYPSKAESRRFLFDNWRFPLLNWEFGVLLGVFYWLLAVWLLAAPHLDTHIIVLGILVAGFTAYSGYQERGRIAAASLDPEEELDDVWRHVEKGKAWLWVLGPPLLHAIAHFIALTSLTWLFGRVNAELLGVEPGGWASFFLLALEMVPAGGFAAGFIFGANLWITARFCNINHNDAFSAMRRDSHRQFLRLRIQGDTLTIFPIALDRVPQRHEWRLNPEPGGSVFVPPPHIRPHLIEPPIVIRSAAFSVSAATSREAAAAPAAPT
jgi:hypothetical protein